MIVLVSERTHTSVFLNDWSRVRECVGSVLWQWVRDMAESQSILRYAMQSDPPRRSEPVRRAQPAGRSLVGADGRGAAAERRHFRAGPPQEGVGYASRAGSAPQLPPTPTRARASCVKIPHI